MSCSIEPYWYIEENEMTRIRNSISFKKKKQHYHLACNTSSDLKVSVENFSLHGFNIWTGPVIHVTTTLTYSCVKFLLKITAVFTNVGILTNYELYFSLYSLLFSYRSTKFFYLSGIILGVLALLVFVLLTLKRFIPRVNLHL